MAWSLCAWAPGHWPEGAGFTVPQAQNLFKCDHLDRDRGRGRRAAHHDLGSPGARANALCGAGRRSLGAGGRDLGGWAARDARMGARTDEFVPDCARTRQHGGRRNRRGTGAAHAGLDLTFAASAVVALNGLALGYRFSINFATDAKVDAAPINLGHSFPVVPEHDDGPIRITIEYAVASENRAQFGTLMEEVQATIRRNGAFQCRLDESLDQPGLFQLEYVVSTWAEYLRQNARMTVDETQVYRSVWNLHTGGPQPVVRYYRLGFANLRARAKSSESRQESDPGKHR